MNWIKRHWIIVVVLMAYSIIIFMPPIIHGYVYPNTGDDTAFHLRYFASIQNGVGGAINYLGQNIVGYPLVWLSNITGVSINALFLWFNFVVLWLVGISAFVLVGGIVGWKVGLLAIPLVMFMTPSTLNLYDTGAIYDLMTVGILLPLSIFCFVKLWISKKWQWLLPLLVGVILVVVIHTMVLWSGAKLVNPYAEAQVLLPSEFASVFVGYSIMLSIGIYIFLTMRNKQQKIEKREKILLACLGTLIVVMLVLVFTGFMGWSVRIALDVSIIIPLFVACLLGIALKSDKNKLAWGIVGFFIVLASVPVLSSYEQYHSAVKPVDLQAIKYVNSLSGDYYSCSPEVAPWIYDRFLNKKYRGGALPYIDRSEPMTPRTFPNNIGYWWDEGAIGYSHSDNVVYDGEINKVFAFAGDGLRIMVMYQGGE